MWVSAWRVRCRACRWAEARHRFGTFEAAETCITDGTLWLVAGRHRFGTFEAAGTCITDGTLRLGYSAIGFAHLQALGHA